MRKGRPAKPAPMLDLEIIMTNRCNQACSYCYTRHLRGGADDRTLTFPQLKRFVDLVSKDPKVRRTFTGPVKLEFSGGEPLLEFDLVKRTIDYIRSEGLDFELAVATNGTLLTKERADYFFRNGVLARVSLDGTKPVNDLHRKFAGKKAGSVFEAVTANIRRGYPGPERMDRCCITPTLTPETVDALPEIVDFFRHDLGARTIPVGLEAYGIWERADVERFRAALRRMIDGFLEALKPGSDVKRTEAAFAEFPIRRELKSEDEGREYTSGTLALHYDGFFYPSPDFVTAPPPIDPKYRIGDLENGIDLDRLEAILSPMLDEVSRKCAYRSGPRNPVEGYYWGIANGYPEKKIDRILESTSELNRAFQEETSYYLSLFTIYKRLYTTPGFGDFIHPPRYRGDKEIRRFRLKPEPGTSVVRLREYLDLFLYSPGNNKELSLELPTAGTAGRELAEGLSLYALMKACYLGKNLRLTRGCGLPGYLA
ncbi:MAG: radical SAM protein [Elusimicrobiales bacterium]|nr:radical SAM protein [Elusimicrobiales bacterium]